MNDRKCCDSLCSQGRDCPVRKQQPGKQKGDGLRTAAMLIAPWAGAAIIVIYVLRAVQW